MTRRFLITLACIALPFVLYAIYDYFRRRRIAAERDPWPLAILWLTGAVIAIELMVLSVITDTGITEPPISPAARSRLEAP